MPNLDELLKEHRIAVLDFHHQPVFTCEQAMRELGHVPGAPTKNLFLVARREETYFLVAVPETKRVNLKALAPLLNVKKLAFATAEELKDILGVTPGAVTLLGVINDDKLRAQVIIDQELWQGISIQAHALVNTRTLVISPEELAKIFAISGHKEQVLEVPAM